MISNSETTRSTTAERIFGLYTRKAVNASFSGLST